MAQGGGIARLALKQRVAHESLYEWVGHKMTTSRVLSGPDAQNTSLDIVLLSEDRPEVQVVTYRDVFNKVRIPTGNSIPLGTSKCTLPPLMMLNKRLMTGAPLMSPERQ